MSRATGKKAASGKKAGSSRKPKAGAANTRARQTSTRSKKRRPRKAGGPGFRALAFLGAGLRAFFTWRVIRALILIVGCLAGGAGAGAGAKALWSWLVQWPGLAIQEVVIKTGPRVPAPEVRMLADLSEGDNILGFRLSDCVEAIEIHPWVKRASVTRELPDRVKIEIKERNPVAVIALGAVYYVDEDGEIFKKVLPGDTLDYPVITGINLFEVVEDKEQVDCLVKQALEIIALARGSHILALDEVSEIHLHRFSGATVVRTSDAMRIRFGRGGFKEKWDRMERALVELSGDAKKVYELDLNYEGRVTIRLREGYRVASARAEPPHGQ